MRDRRVKQQEKAAEDATTEERHRRPVEDYGAQALSAWQRIAQYRISDLHFYRRQATALREHAARSRHPEIRSQLLAAAEKYESMGKAIEHAMRFRPWRVGAGPAPQRHPAARAL